MYKLFLLPPIIVAMFLVAVNWLDIYQTPDTIVIPVLFEIIYFLLFLLFAAPTYWLLVLPLCFLVIKSTAWRFGGILTGLFLAVVVPCVMVAFEWLDFSWRGTLSSHHVLQVILPLLFLAIYGYFLLYQQLKERTDGDLLPWLSSTALLSASVGLGIFLVSAMAVISYWNRAPQIEQASWSITEEPIKGRVLLDAQQHVITALLNKRGGLLRDERLPPAVLLENLHYWERGVEGQLHTFSRFLDHTSFFFENPVKSTRRRPQLPYVLETPVALRKANDQIRVATGSSTPGQAETLYEQALANIEQVAEQLIKADVRVKGERKLKWWFQDAASTLATPGTTLLMDDDRIEQAKHPDKYSPRKRAILAIQPLWQENNALYEAYGSAWALKVYLDAVAVEYETTLEAHNAMTLLQSAQQSLAACLPGLWTPLLLTSSGIDQLQSEIRRVGQHMNQAMHSLNDIMAVLPR